MNRRELICLNSYVWENFFLNCVTGDVSKKRLRSCFTHLGKFSHLYYDQSKAIQGWKSCTWWMWAHPCCWNKPWGARLNTLHVELSRTLHIHTHRPAWLQAQVCCSSAGPWHWLSTNTTACSLSVIPKENLACLIWNNKSQENICLLNI